MEQTSLTFEIAEPSVTTLNDMVRVLLSAGQWLTPWEMCEEIWRTKGIRVSDATITSRARDLRKPQYGSHNISIRKRTGSRAYEYHLEGK